MSSVNILSGRHKYKVRKAIFWTIVVLLMILLLIFTLNFKKPGKESRLIRVAVCGCVKNPAVYTMRESSDVAMLVSRAGGFKLNADINRVNLDRVVLHDSVYHIPCRSLKSDSSVYGYKMAKEVNSLIRTSYVNLTNEIVAERNENELKYYSILYVGIPAVFVIINYYPELQRINFVHVPHSAIFLNNDYRLIDLFFTLDVYPTMRIIEHKLKQKLDFYLIQDRFNFIDLIDMLGGVNLNIDKPYADEYDMSAGKNQIDGFHAWEYIRFLDWRNIRMNVDGDKKMHLVSNDNFQIEPKILERTYELRNQRQRHVLEGMRSSFLDMDKVDQLKLLTHFKDVFRTDMTNDFLMQMYSDLLSTPHFSYGNIPGYYSGEGNKLFFYPDLPLFESLKNKEIRTYLESRKGLKQTVY